MRFLVLVVYNLLLPIFFVLAFPSWLIKMGKRGGIGSGLLERFSFFKLDAESEKQGAIYIHAVSVGEVLIGIKLIKQWLIDHPQERMLLVPTTATGHAVAMEYAPDGVRVIYSPLDFGFVLRRVFKRFEPKQIILMESEIWPNMLNVARKLNIPVSIANARLSQRSEKRYCQLSFLLKPLLEMISKLCSQDEIDKERWVNAGVADKKVVVTGSVKFDQSGAVTAAKRKEFSAMLIRFGHKPVVMAISTNIGEEAWIAAALVSIKDEIRLAIVPRHAERRADIVKDLERIGYTPELRSKLSDEVGDCLVIDSTGELREWTADADIVIVGKSILAKGGQNPTEAIAAGVPVIVGPYMGNFEPLISHLKSAGGIIEIIEPKELVTSVTGLLKNEGARNIQTEAAIGVLESHQGATKRTVEALKLM